MSSLRPLDDLKFASRPVPAKHLGKPAEFQWIEISRLRVDPDYQRHILDSGRANIRRMIEEFSWLKFGTLVVSSRPGGVYAVIDGQHRATAAKLHGGIEAVPCLIHKASVQEEAWAFFATNGNVTRVHALQSFRARVAAGDKAARNLVDICNSCGVVLAGYPKADLEPGETMALGTIQSIVKRLGADVLVASCKLLRRADSTAGLAAAAIAGVAETLAKRPEWKCRATELGDRLARPDFAATFLGKALARKATHGGPLWVNFAAVLTTTITATLQAGGQDMRRLMAGR